MKRDYIYFHPEYQILMIGTGMRAIFYPDYFWFRGDPDSRIKSHLFHPSDLVEIGKFN
jgi:hypothetical protein